MPKVVILQRVLSHYRVPFFQGLKERLLQDNIELDIIHGLGNKDDKQREFLTTLEWAKAIKETYIPIGRKLLVFQPYLKFLKDADLIIVPQELKWLLIHYLILRRQFIHYKLAFWGHGLDRQLKPSSFVNLVKKKFFNNAVDWWFAYTKGVADFVAENGFPTEKITTIQNALDTKGLSTIKENISSEELNGFRNKLGITNGIPVGLFCGGMYKEKRLDFLLESCHRIKKSIPDLHMIFIGGGTSEHIVRAASQKNPWIHVLGPIYEREKVLSFLLSDVFLMPGLVGLAILDSFALETPIVTTEYPFHSPEIEYLENDKNGIMTKDNLEDYCQSVVHALTTPNKIKLLREGCRKSVRKYTLDQMIRNFSDGIIKCTNS